jgi:hypothetical protein
LWKRVADQPIGGLDVHGPKGVERFLAIGLEVHWLEDAGVVHETIEAPPRRNGPGNPALRACGILSIKPVVVGSRRIEVEPRARGGRIAHPEGQREALGGQPLGDGCAETARGARDRDDPAFGSK